MRLGFTGQEFWSEYNVGIFAPNLVDSIFGGPINIWKNLLKNKKKNPSNFVQKCPLVLYAKNVDRKTNWWFCTITCRYHIFFWKWFVSPIFFKIFQIVFVWKTCFLGVFVTYFMCKFNWELNSPILKFFSFGQGVLRLFHGCFVSKAYQWNTSEILARY